MKRAMTGLVFAAMFLSLAGNAMAYVITDDATGGDCASIGTWDAGTKTCTLTADLTEGITINSDYVTLDGNNHVLLSTGYQSGDYAVNFFYRSGLIIRNMSIKNFRYGIYGFASSGNTIADNLLLNTGVGIELRESRNNTLTNNAVSGSRYYGIDIASYSLNNELTGNTVSGCGAGVVIFYSGQNALRQNIISNNQIGLILTSGSASNVIYNNTFNNNSNQALDYVGSNTFNLPAPVGGNYWSDYDAPEEGCYDLNLDSFCDASRYFKGGIDHLPWTKNNGWLCGMAPEFEITLLTPTILWPPDHEMREVVVSGRVITPKGCSLKQATYSTADEYGIVSSTGNLNVDATGAFSLVISLEAWRDGNDSDGRQYIISFVSENEAGEGETNIEILVPHDLGEK